MRPFALLVALFASSLALAAEAPLEFTLTWEEGEFSRDASGSESKFTVKGGQVTRESRSWGRDDDLRMPGRKKPGPTSVKLTPEQAKELREAFAATQGLTDVKIETQQDVGRVRLVTLSAKGADGNPRVVTLEAYLGNDHARGPKGLVLDPPPSDAKAAAHPAVKTHRALYSLYTTLLLLFPS
jgi:hypothetical protein